jgi:hypothetical protein
VHRNNGVACPDSFLNSGRHYCCFPAPNRHYDHSPAQAGRLRPVLPEYPAIFSIKLLGWGLAQIGSRNQIQSYVLVERSHGWRKLYQSVAQSSHRKSWYRWLHCTNGIGDFGTKCRFSSTAFTFMNICDKVLNVNLPKIIPVLIEF